jgi:hypothetical protein
MSQKTHYFINEKLIIINHADISIHYFDNLMDCDTIFCIISLLDSHDDIINCGQVNKLFNQVSNSEIIWRGLCELRYSSLPSKYKGSYKIRYRLCRFASKNSIPYKTANSKVMALASKELFTLSKDIGLFPKLSKLNLYDNCLRSLPTEMKSLTQLTQLHLHDNIFIEIPDMIYKLTNLRILALSDNLLRSIPGKIGCLNNLCELYLNSNYLTQIPREIGCLMNLNILDLSDNSLETLPEEISDLMNLKKIYVHDNPLVSLPSSFSSLKNLIEFHISVKLTHMVPYELAFAIHRR